MHPETDKVKTEEPKPRGPGRPRQEEMVGFEAIEDKKLRALAEAFDEARTAAMSQRKNANDANAKIVRYMVEHKINRVQVGDLFVFVDPGHSKAVVRSKSPSEDAANTKRGKRDGADEE